MAKIVQQTYQCRRCHGKGYKLARDPEGWTGMIRVPCAACNGVGWAVKRKEAK